MAPPISDAVIVDVFRRVDRLLAPSWRRLGRPPSPPAGRARPVVGRPGAAGRGRRRRGAALRSGSSPTCSRCRTPWGRRSSRSSSWAWRRSTESTTPPSASRCSPASCCDRDLPAEQVRADAAPGPGDLPGRGARRSRERGRAPGHGSARSGGSAGCWAGSTTPSTPAPRGSCGTGRCPTCPWSACSAATPAEREGERRAAARAAVVLGERGQRIGAATAPSLAGSTSASTAGSVARLA